MNIFINYIVINHVQSFVVSWGCIRKGINPVSIIGRCGKVAGGRVFSLFYSMDRSESTFCIRPVKMENELSWPIQAQIYNLKKRMSDHCVNCFVNLSSLIGTSLFLPLNSIITLSSIFTFDFNLQAHTYVTPREFLDLPLNASESRKRFNGLWKRRELQAEIVSNQQSSPFNAESQQQRTDDDSFGLYYICWFSIVLKRSANVCDLSIKFELFVVIYCRLFKWHCFC